MLTRRNGNTAGWPLDRSWRGLSDLRRGMDQLFTDFDRNSMPQGSRGDLVTRSQPQVELSDDGSALRLRMDVPGFVAKDIQIDLDRSTLTVRGARDTSTPEGYAVHRQERGSLSFARTMTLPCRIDADAVEATLRDGVLELRLPKAPEEQPRTIEVRATN